MKTLYDVKRWLILGSLALLIIPGSAMAVISGSAHDFSTNTSWNTTGEICIVCHTPHNGNTSAPGPLWNHEQSGTTTYTLYSSSTLDATLTQPAGLSKLCLGCHDGTVALEAFGGVTTGTNFAPSTVNLGTTLANDHPVAFTYNDALASTDGELHPPTTTASGLGSTIAIDMLFSGSLECATCHDVHNSNNNAYLLVKSNTSPASGLCLTCHDK